MWRIAMEEANRRHKETSFGWVRLIQDFLEASAKARRDRAIVVWGDSAATEVWAPRPDQTYKMVRSAFAPGRPHPKQTA